MKHILVVDDAATVRLYYRNILEPAGYGVEEAMNGIEALEKALQQSFDLYLVDLNMPKMDGYTFVRELRGRELKQVPVVMISTEAQQRDKGEAFQAGANIYLIKPVKPDELLAYCRYLLGEVVP